MSYVYMTRSFYISQNLSLIHISQLRKNRSIKSINNSDFTEKTARTLGIMGYAIAMPAEAA